MSRHEGFSVDLDSLTAFGHELKTQLSGMTQPLGHLKDIVGDQVKLGAFHEADALWHNHDTAAEQMSVLVGQARDAIDFADEITKSVSVCYDHFDDTLNASLTNTGNQLGALGGVLGGTLGGVVGGVGGVVGGILDPLDGGTGSTGQTGV